MTEISRYIREKVLKRDGYLCVRCLADIKYSPRSVHHRKLRSRGGRNTVENLVTLCGTGTIGCHAWAHSRVREATRQGWLCPSWADPADWPVERRPGVWSQPGDIWTRVTGPVLVPVVGEAS